MLSPCVPSRLFPLSPLPPYPASSRRRLPTLTPRAEPAASTAASCGSLITAHTAQVLQWARASSVDAIPLRCAAHPRQPGTGNRRCGVARWGGQPGPGPSRHGALTAPALPGAWGVEAARPVESGEPGPAAGNRRSPSALGLAGPERGLARPGSPVRRPREGERFLSAGCGGPGRAPPSPRAAVRNAAGGHPPFPGRPRVAGWSLSTGNAARCQGREALSSKWRDLVLKLLSHLKKTPHQ